MITNQDKPNVSTPQTELIIGSGYKLRIGGLFHLIVGALGLGGMTNTDKVSQGETWGSITSSWASEVRSWQEVSQLIDNTSKITSSMTNFAKP